AITTRCVSPRKGPRTAHREWRRTRMIFLRVEGWRASLISLPYTPHMRESVGEGGRRGAAIRISRTGSSMQKPFLAADGTSAIDRANDDIGEAMRLRLFRTQVELREAEQRAYDLFLQNLVKGTSHLSLGQEAIAAGFANAMKSGDLSFCTYRGH